MTLFRSLLHMIGRISQWRFRLNLGWILLHFWNPDTTFVLIVYRCNFANNLIWARINIGPHSDTRNVSSELHLDTFVFYDLDSFWFKNIYMGEYGLDTSLIKFNIFDNHWMNQELPTATCLLFTANNYENYNVGIDADKILLLKIFMHVKTRQLLYLSVNMYELIFHFKVYFITLQ